jgi:rubrerythrin
MLYLNKLWLAGAMVIVTALSASTALAKDLDPQTKQNLETAMHGEAYANLKYKAYAKNARDGGNEELAMLFEKIARDEASEHFVLEADAAGLVKDNRKNLQDAVQNENYEYVKMYKEFSEQAAKAGDMQAAKVFDKIRADEAAHQEEYKAALLQLEHMHAAK